MIFIMKSHYASEFNHYWRMWDCDGSGSIEPSEIPRIVTMLIEHFPRTEVSPIPDIRTCKDKWYDYWDEDANGTLQKEEVVRAFVKTFNVSRQDLATVISIRETLNNIWILFDHDSSGSIDKNEFLGPNGLADTIVAQLQFS